VRARRWNLAKHIEKGGRCEECAENGLECQLDTRTERRTRCRECHDSQTRCIFALAKKQVTEKKEQEKMDTSLDDLSCEEEGDD
jgi:hypothetical protein